MREPLQSSPRTPRRKQFRQRHLVTLPIPPDLLREAIVYAKARGTPLRRRLCPTRDDDTTVLALTMSDDGDYYLSTEDVESLPVPRRLHLAWVRERLGDAAPDELLDTLEAALGDAYVEGLRDTAVGDEGMALDERTYAQVFGGPVRGSDAKLSAWLAEEIDFEDAAGIDWYHRVMFLRGHSVPYAVLERAVEACKLYLPWRDPDTGQALGRVGYIAHPCSDGTLAAETAVAVTCFQWTCDLLGLGIRVKVRRGY